MNIAIYIFFGLWTAGSLLVLIPRLAPWMRDHDIFELIPEWKFFAPIPGRGDFHLLYRDIYTDGLTDWTEIAVGGERRWWNFLWHPRRRERKAVFDIARELRHHLGPENQATAHLSVPYLTLLTYTCGQPRTVFPRKTQFLLMYSEAAIDDGEPHLNLLSYMHEFLQ